MPHHKWTEITPPTWREGQWAIRSMLWIKNELEAEQIHTGSPDLTAAIIHLEHRRVLVFSVYVAGEKEGPGAIRALRYAD